MGEFVGPDRISGPLSREAAPDRSPWVERSGTLGPKPCEEKPRTRTGRRKTNGCLRLCSNSIRKICSYSDPVDRTHRRYSTNMNSLPLSIARR